MADNRAVAMRFLQGKGLTSAQAAGVVGSLMQESGLRVDAQNPSSGALGIAQWLGGRKSNLLAQKGTKDLEGQLNFLWSELQGPERSALNRLRAARSVEDAAAAFTWGFERPGKAEANMPNRIRQAQAALRVGGGTSAGTEPAPQSAEPAGSVTQATPGTDNRAARAQLVLNFLNQKGADPLSFVTEFKALADVPGTTTTTRTPSADTSEPAAPTGSGAFKISGPNPGRLKPELTSFADKVASVYGGKLEGLDGSTHSKFTTTGNVSEHYTGNATDIFTIGGKKKGDPGWQQALVSAGRAALIAAGMPRSQAMKAGPGLYNVGNHQIIFGTNSAALGGDHTDHLHISSHAQKR